MRPRNVLTQTNNMRKLMGLPLLNEDTGTSAEDVKKKVLTEDRAFSLGFGNQGGLTLDETTEAEETEEEGVGAPVNDVVEEQTEDPQYGSKEWYDKYVKVKMPRLKKKDGNKTSGTTVNEEEDYGEGPLGIETGIDVGSPQPGDGEGGLGLNTDAQVFAEGSFSKYNITLQDKMDLLTEQGGKKKRYNFDTIEIEDYEKEDKAFAKEEDRVLKRFENILNREGFEFQNMVPWGDSDKEVYFYTYDDKVKVPIETLLIRREGWDNEEERIRRPNRYAITHEDGWDGKVVEGDWNRDSLSAFKNDLRKVKSEAPDYFDEEAIWD